MYCLSASASTSARPQHQVHIRESLISHARELGWDVVGHRWLRMTRGTVTIEVWFTDTQSRVARARHHAAGVQTREVDIIHNPRHQMSLDALVLQWLGLSDQPPTPPPPAVNSFTAM